jgi:hypothetical protein
MARTAGNSLYGNLALGLRGSMQLRLGRLEEAAQLLCESEARAHTEHHRLLYPMVADMRALCELHRGHLEEARALAAEALGQAVRTPPTVVYVLNYYPVLSEVYAELYAERPSLEAEWKRALALSKRYARVFPIGRPGACLHEGQWQLAHGQRQAAQRAFGESLATAHHYGMPYEEAMAEGWLGRSNEDEGRPLLESARARMRALGMSREAARFEAWLDRG